MGVCPVRHIVMFVYLFSVKLSTLGNCSGELVLETVNSGWFYLSPPSNRERQKPDNWNYFALLSVFIVFMTNIWLLFVSAIICCLNGSEGQDLHLRGCSVWYASFVMKTCQRKHKFWSAASQVLNHLLFYASKSLPTTSAICILLISN